MEFSSDRVYSAVNADELNVGDVCIFANDLATLEYNVVHNLEQDTILAILKDDQERRIVRETGRHYALAYLVETASVRGCQPFQTAQEFVDACQEHGSWVYQYGCSKAFLISSITVEGELDEIQIGDQIVSPTIFCTYWRFLLDDSPCGVPR